LKIYISRISIQNCFLYIYFFSINFENFNPTGYFSVSRLAGILYIVSILPSIKNFLKFRMAHAYFYIPLIIFTIYLTLISLINVNNFSSRFIDFAMIQNILIFILMVNHARKDRNALEKGMLFMGLGAVLVSILMTLGIGVSLMTEDIYGTVNRITFFNAELNEIGLKLVAGIMIIIATYFNNPLKLNSILILFLVFTTPLMIYSIIGTASRTAVLTLLLCGLTWLLFRSLASKNKFLTFILSSIILIIILVPAIFFTSQIETFELLAARIEDTGGISDRSEAGRFSLWIGFYNLIFTNIIFGNGYSGFDLITYEYFGFLESPHNVFLEIILYTGLIGLVLYSLFLLRALKAAYFLFSRKKLLLPILIAPVAFSFIFILQGLSEKICWIFLAYVIGTYIYNNENLSIPLKK